MKIKSLTLHGFKSFADRTKLDFHEGITAIVGPNGCGKSNISDSIRWVLGEQRPTVIRGSRMDEAIFGGTEQRRPIHRAEVSLLLSNEEGRLAVPYSEVEIGRTVYRGGESAYTLNGAACRLRDILDLCRDTGLGANAYSIIEARMIDAILSDRAEERRALFEEAAEIGRYKDRRRTALRRLEAATGDLQRLEDLIGEVKSKVRSLARQRGRADRHVEYRERLLRLEVSVSGARLSDIEERIDAATAKLEGLRREAPGEEAQLQKQEARLENLRLRVTEESRARSGLADRVATTRDRLNRLESEGLVEAERAATNQTRLEAIETELAELAGRRASVSSELERLAEAKRASDASLTESRQKEASLGQEAERLEKERESEASSVEDVLGRYGDLVRRIGALSSERAAAAERHEERQRELERRRALLDALEQRGHDAERQMGDAEQDVARAKQRRAALGSDHEKSRAELAAAREKWRQLRDDLADAQGELSANRARLSSLATVLAGGSGRPAAVSRLLSDKRAPAGVIGPLVDYLDVPADLAGAVEAHLGVYLHAVLVEDWAAVEAVRDWLKRDDEQEGLVLLPVDPGSTVEGSSNGSDLLARVSVGKPAESWAAALLGSLHIAASFEPSEHAWVLQDGSGQDRYGAVRLGSPTGGGSLALRGKIEELEREVELGARAAEGAESALQAAAEALAGCESRAEAILEEFDEAGRALQDAENRRDAALARLESSREESEAVASRIEELGAAVDGFAPRQEERERELALLGEQEAAAEAAVAEARKRVRRAGEEWETARAALHAEQLDLARLESEAKATAERYSQAELRQEEIRGQRERLEAEREERRALGESLADRAAQRESDMLSLIEERSEAEEALAQADAELNRLREEADAEEASVREARRSEREHSELRHGLELELAEQRARRSSIRERLEAEWDEGYEALAGKVEPLGEGTLDEWAAELEELRDRIRKLGPVNPLAAQEYEEEKERLAFLEEQRNDLTQARDDLQASIRRINRAAAEAFLETFEEIRANFKRTFATLFEGGACDLWLDPEDPLDSPIEISASPGGKRTQRIHLLSGGERALTALSLLFAIYLAKPSPFCVMDEVDAPLDEANIGRFVRMLEEFKEGTQFVVITHNPRTIEAADWIYGVTMQEPGVSSIVGVEFRDLPSGQVA